MENVLTLATDDLVNSNALQINVGEDGLASTVGLPVNVVPAEGSYVIKQLDDGTTVLLDAMTFLNHMGGQLVLNSAPVGTDLLTHSIFNAVDADPAGHQLIQGLETVTEEVPLDVPPAAPAGRPLSSVEALLAESGDLTGHRDPGEPDQEAQPAAPVPQLPTRGRVPRLYPPEPEEEPPGPAPWTCPRCCKRFNLWKRYLNHVKLHDYEKPYKCYKCREEFNFEKNLQLHLVTHNPNQLQCPDCDRLFRRFASLRSHLAVHEVEETILCPHCQQDFPTQVLLDKHLPVHTAPAAEEDASAAAPAVEPPAARPPQPQQPAKQPDCLADAAAEALADTTELVLVRQPPPPDSLHCTQCKMVFTNYDDLQEHVRAHRTVQSLLTVKQRRRRPKTATPSGRTRCKLCEKTFAKPGLLTRHMLIHTGERPFKCEQCDRAFNQKNALKVHIESKHGKLRPHQCQLCRLSFAQKGNLRNHVRRVHNLSETTQRSHVCSQCGCGFTSAAVLSSHVSKMHERPPGAEIGPEALRDLVKQLLEYSAANEAARERIHAQIADIAGSIVDDDLPTVLAGLVGKKASAAAAAAARSAGTGAGPTEKDGQTAPEGERSQEITLPDLEHVEQQDDQQQQQQMDVGSEPVPDVSVTPVVRTVHELTAAEPAAVPITAEPGAEADVEPAPEPGAQPVTEPATVAVTEAATDTATDTAPERLPVPPTTSSISPAKAASIISSITSAAAAVAGPSEDGEDPGRHRPAIITLVDKVGWASGARRSWANSDGDPGSDSAAHQQGRKYLVRVRYEGRRRWFQCLFCTKEFRKPYDLVRHLRIHTKDKPFKCAQCHRTFTVRSGLEAHMRVHRGVKLASCPICQKEFSTASVLRVHLRVHTGAKPYSCQYCNKAFRTLGNKNTHESFHRAGDLDDNGKDMRAQRRKADATGIDDVQLEPPIRITDDGSLVQEDTRRGQQQQLADGESSEDRPHRCSICHLAFKKVSHMRQHYRRHTGERPHQCRFCSKGFITSSALTTHERTHTGARFYKCPICSVSFTTGSSLKRHMSTHTEDRPFMCPYCHRRFKTRIICAKHTRTHKADLARGVQPQPDVECATALGVGADEPEPDPDPDPDPDPEPEPAGDGGGDGALFSGLMGEEEQQLLTAGLADGGYTARAQNVSVIVDHHGRMVQCELAPGQVQTLTTNPDGTVAITGLTEHQSGAQAGLDHQLASGLEGQLFTSAQLTQDKAADASGAHPQTLVITNIASLGQTNDGTVAVAETGLDPAAAAGGDIDSDDDEVLRLRNEQHGQMILEMDSDNILLQDPSLSQPLIHRCRICKKMFTTQLALAAHEEEHGIGVTAVTPAAPAPAAAAATRPTEAHLCTQCVSVFGSAEQLAAHQATHEPQPAQQPPAPAQSRPAAAAAAQEPQEETGHQCTICGASFLNATSLKKHMAGEHKKSKKKNKPVIRLSEKLTAKLAEQPLNTTRSQAEICLIQSAVEKVQNGPVPRAEPEDAAEVQLKHSCQICNKAFRKPSDLVRHVRTHTGEKPFACEICGKRFTVKSTLLGHMRTHSGQRDFHCLVCKASFSTKCSLRVHSRLHTGARPYVCEVCGRAFRTSGHRSIHMTTHGFQRGGRRAGAAAGEKAADGQTEGRQEGGARGEQTAGQTLTAQLQGVLEELTAGSAGQKSAAGGSRGRSQARTQLVTSDAILEEDADDPGVQLKQEDPAPASAAVGQPAGGESVLQLEAGLAEQLQLVLASQTPVGASGLPMDTELRVQLQIDADGRIVGVEAVPPTEEEAAAAAEPAAGGDGAAEPAARPDPEQARTLRQVVAGALQEVGATGSLRCTVCERAFTSQGQWRRHMRTHGVEVAAPATGRSAHICPDCLASFPTASQLTRHRRTHTGEKPYKCELCERAFSQKNALQVHAMTHVGERPHTCPFCGHGFAQKGNMRTHIRRAHLKSALDTLVVDAGAVEEGGAQGKA
ncbi:zinc finger protein 236-like [Amphibalanus amphitrite]|uniref:zinc finger protein 236-like n=1 Tax=Amphibalanus amphitrite TaxID=1232801 RepID=UPI001C8FCAC2|nr:zinc finger protein 236-like [Amphibalanus amphitrite]